MTALLPLWGNPPAIPRAIAGAHTDLTEDELSAPRLKRRYAKANGERYYRSAKLCPEGHNPTIRFVTSGCCVQCTRANGAAYKSLNPEAWYSSRSKYAEAHKERRRETSALWRLHNAERIRLKNAEWRAAHPGATKAWGIANPGAKRALKLKRRARLLGCGGVHTAKDIQEIKQAQRGKCAYCRCRLPDKFHRDHILPIKLGGTNDRSNIQLLCQRCNNRKSAKHPIKFAQEMGFIL